MPPAESQLFVEKIHQLVVARGQQMARRGPLAELDFGAEESRARGALDGDAARAGLDFKEADGRALRFAQLADDFLARDRAEAEPTAGALRRFPAELRGNPRGEQERGRFAAGR